jgi:DNA-binding XRE family transcriptional regulator
MSGGSHLSKKSGAKKPKISKQDAVSLEKERFLQFLGLINETPKHARPRSRQKPNLNPVATAIASERIRLGYTQRSLASAAGVGFDTIRRVEQGELAVSLRILLKLLNFLDLKIEIVPRSKRL